jgi:hypothetical protein
MLIQVESWECDLKVPNLPPVFDQRIRAPAAAVLGQIYCTCIVTLFIAFYDAKSDPNIPRQNRIPQGQQYMHLF